MEHSGYCQFCTGIVTQINFYPIILKLAENQIWIVWVMQSLFTVYSKKIYSAVGSFSRQRPQTITLRLYKKIN